ncbi:hypothetical protein C0J45_3767 [Silurus meridionalis]|uniref:Uncharacterized protein n=1 Tax=Silurus meridionalis TaxID=175797 RepID=A0A8T0BMT4_SILME|nr:hypothetical protein HF521_017476 [Silurus meridionalis]KAI5106070.1 hypothetical protein C0J45_3767 [Silurus meridionalis]
MYDCAFDVKQLRKRRISGRERSGEERSGAARRAERSGGEERGERRGEDRGEGAQEKGELECRTQLHNVHLHGSISAHGKAHATSLRLAFSELSARTQKKKKERKNDLGAYLAVIIDHRSYLLTARVSPSHGFSKRTWEMIILGIASSDFSELLSEWSRAACCTMVYRGALCIFRPWLNR